MFLRMPEHSDLSGDAFDGSRPSEVTVTLEDGSRQRLNVTLAEHERFRGLGKDVSHLHQRAWAWICKWVRKAVPWVLGACVAAAITAAITQYVTTYYADRQQELDLKSLLATTLSRAAVEGADDALSVVNVQVERDQRGLAVIERRNHVTAAWNGAAAVIDPLLFLHFDETAVEDHWNRFRPALFDYLALSYSDTVELRARHVATVRDYLYDYPPPDSPIAHAADFSWSRLSCPRLRCDETRDWRDDYRTLGLALLRERGVLTRALLATDAQRLG